MAELWNHESQICQACDVSSPGVVAWPLVCLCPCNLATGREQLLSSQTKRQKTAWERNARLHGRRQQVSMLASYFASHGGQCQYLGIKANLCFSQVILISRRCGPVWTIPFQTKQVYISSRRSRVLLPWFTTLSPPYPDLMDRNRLGNLSWGWQLKGIDWANSFADFFFNTQCSYQNLSITALLVSSSHCLATLSFWICNKRIRVILSWAWDYNEDWITNVQTYNWKLFCGLEDSLVAGCCLAQGRPFSACSSSIARKLTKP